MAAAISVIDLFAGPGGLSEGFSRHGEEDWSQVLSAPCSEQPVVAARATRFDVALSVEMDTWAHETLELRALVRKLNASGRRALYYEFLERLGACGCEDYQAARDALFAEAEGAGVEARQEAWRATLGDDQTTEQIDGRIKKALGTQKGKWVLIGGPPCQAYSLVGRARNKGVKGYRRESDKRHFLYQEYLRIVATHRPPVFVMENVKGLLSSEVLNESIFERIRGDLSRPAPGLEYELFPIAASNGRFGQIGSLFERDSRDFIVKMENHGIPQARHRVILLGVRGDVGRRPGSLTVRERVSVRDVLGDLPHLRSGLSSKGAAEHATRADSAENWHEAISVALEDIWLKQIDSREVVERIKSVIEGSDNTNQCRGRNIIKRVSKVPYAQQWYRPAKFGYLLNHETRGHMRSDLHRYLFASAWADVNGRSPSLAQFPVGLLPEHANVHKSHPVKAPFSDRFCVQIPDEPAMTITSHIHKDGHYYIHYDPAQCRSLTVREAARLQTFPDDYYFCGPRTEQYKQVGNAVPPLAATQIASIVAGLLS